MHPRIPLNDSTRQFEAAALPHLGAAYNLARWLLRDDQHAHDAVQEAYLRAFRFFDGLRGESARPWLLGIVRNTCFTMLERTRNQPQWVDFDDAEFEAALVEAPHHGADPVLQLQQQRIRLQVDAAIRALSPPLREVIVLREFEDLDYAQIAKIVAVPIGTVMSRLARARDHFASVWHSHARLQERQK
jgi:RNA polymerase sigma-70 factor (ECF subfamily)